MNYEEKNQYDPAMNASALGVQGMGAQDATCAVEVHRHVDIAQAVHGLGELEYRLVDLCARIAGEDSRELHQKTPHNPDPSFSEVLNGTSAQVRDHSQRMHNVLTTLESLLF